MVAYLKAVRQFNRGKEARNLSIIAKHTGLETEQLLAMCWPILQGEGYLDLKSVLDYQAVRVCAAARDLGLDLSGCTFLVGGEPVTPGKASCIESVGGGVASGYSMTETSMAGLACLNSSDPSDVHLLSDAQALIQDNRTVPGTAVEVQAFYLTSLLPTAPKVMLNVDTGDHGVVEERSCGCAWETLGFGTHLRNIFSSAKLTGQGVTLVGSDALYILEEVLPRKFGGSPLDFQLCETEVEGRTVVELVVSPHLDVKVDHEVVRTFLHAIRESKEADPATAALWRDTGAVRVVRREPLASGRGKVIPLYMNRQIHGPKNP